MAERQTASAVIENLLNIPAEELAVEATEAALMGGSPDVFRSNPSGSLVKLKELPIPLEDISLDGA